MTRPTDVRIRDVEPSSERVAYRTPLKFGGVPSTHATVFTVRVRVETLDGRSAWGSGSLPFGNVWSFPSKRVPAADTAPAMEVLAGRIQERLGDGLPTTMGEGVVQDQLTHLKVKRNGNDAGWDVGRILAIDRVAVATAPRAFTYSLDFNEQCPNVEYLLEVLRRVKEQSAPCFDRVAYVEQPTARDLKAHPENKMHAAAKLKPVVIDESLVDYESLLLSREQGYSGVALKSCKGQSQSLLMAAAAQKFGMFLCVQDLTCPGQSFLQSAGLAAHIGPVTAIEGNARQYCPAANAAWAAKFPGAYAIREGHIGTSSLCGLGLTA